MHGMENCKITIYQSPVLNYVLETSESLIQTDCIFTSDLNSIAALHFIKTGGESATPNRIPRHWAIGSRYFMELVFIFSRSDL
jgi:hypothetical protein